MTKIAHAIYRDFFSAVKNEKKKCRKCFEFFLILAPNIDCGYTLEPHRQGGSNEYTQFMFWSKISIYGISINGIPLHTPFLLHKSRVKGVYIALICFPDARRPLLLHVNCNKNLIYKSQACSR